METLFRPVGLTRMFRYIYSSAIISVVFALTGNNILLAQSTVISIGNTAVQPSVKRLGVNLGTLTYYDSGQTLQNLVMQNPGFEGQIWNSTIRCMGGTATSCVDEDQWSAWPAGFWNGATFDVFYGASAGRSGTVTTSTAPGNGQGVTLNFNNSGVAPANGDYLIVRKTIPGGSSQGWWPATSGAGVISDNFTDLPPGTLGKQTAVLTAPGASDTASIAGYFDSLAGKTFIQMNGTYQLQFKAKGTGGSHQANIRLNRVNGNLYLNQPVSLSNSWNTYNLTFTASENGTAVGTVGVVFSTVGADSFELDDVSLTKINGDPTNTTVFRDPVVNALRLLQPGIIRYWGGQLGETLDNLLTPQFGRQRSGYLAWFSESDTVDYGLHDYLALCQLVGAEPWFVVPTTFSGADASNLIEYLGGSSVTPYGAKRTALGQATPWTSVFSKIHLEFGNEAWNSTFKGGSIEYSEPYGARASYMFGLMRANPSFVTAKYDLVLGGQSAWPGRNTDIQNNCYNNDSFTVAPYTVGQIDSYSDNESIYGPMFAESEAYMSGASTTAAEGLTPGVVFQNYQAIQASSHPVPLSFYEINLATMNGAISQNALNTVMPSLGAGLNVANTMLQALKTFGVANQSMFALTQYNFIRPDGKSLLLWGTVLDMGVTDRKRPQFLAMQLANTALSNGATMLQTVHSGSDPTWNQTLVNTVQFNGAHYLQSYAFQQGASRSLIVFNLSRNSALPVTFSGVNAPSGTVQMQQLTSANLTDTNENSDLVSISAPATLSNFNAAAGLSLPRYSMTVLTWSGSAAPATPVTTTTSGSKSTTGSSSGTKAPSSSSGGTTASSGTSSGTTSSSGTPGGTVVSPSSGAAAPKAPFVGYLASWGITGSGITISWSTDVPATTKVAYGTTSGLGQITPVQTGLVNSHGVTLTKLYPATKYYFVAESTNASGITGYSATYTFTTANQGQAIGGSATLASAGTTAVAASPLASPTTAALTLASETAPKLSFVASWGITSSGITVSWSTDVLSTTAVAYGTTSALGKTTPLQKTLTASHGITVTGLSPLTTYYFAAQSADANGVIGYSSTYTFTTISAGAPAISAISVFPGANNTASISWTTSAPATSYVQYGTTTAYNRYSTLTGLTTKAEPAIKYVPSGVIHYQLVSTNAAGNITTSPDYTFTEP